MKLNVTAASRVGRVRSNNEDMVLVGSSFLRNDDFSTRIELGDTRRILLAVADGMGGHSSGEVASSDALHNLQFFFNDIPAGLDEDGFRGMINEWLVSINAIIDSKGRVDDKFKGMGTTLVGMAYYENCFYSLNCGDSRLYLLRDNELKQLTNDHSLSNMLGSPKHSSIITNCIGGGCKESFVDMVRMTPDVLPDDTYLLCSDGLTDMLTDQDIRKILCSNGDANALCNAAIDAGGFDNVSACVIDVEP